MSTNRKQWAAGALVAAVLLTGCGASASSTATTSSTGAKANPVLDAYQATVAAKSADVTLDETVSGTSAGPISLTGTGEVDFASGASQFSLAIPSAGTVTLRVLTPDMYMRFPPALGSVLPAGKSWVSLNLDTIGKSASGSGSSLSQLSDSAGIGTNSLSYLKGVSATGVTTVGPATIDGVQTTEYSATIDLTKAASQRDAQVRTALENLEAQVHLSSVPIQVWIDAQGQVRQIAVQESLTVAGSNYSVHLTIGFSGFGAPVDVVAPPASQTVDFSSISSLLAGI
jgi:hypothetical protein